MSNSLRIGIFGGTFSPPHLAHLNAARCFYASIELDKLYIMPTYSPPHKSVAFNVSALDRLEMCRIAFAGIDGVSVSDLEVKRGGKSYTVLTLRELYSEDTELYFLCGTDMYLTLDSWNQPDEIFRLATICYIRREADESINHEIAKKTEEYKAKYNAKIFEVKTEPIELSSSLLRDKLCSGEDISGYLPDGVFDYIKKKRLYE